MDSSSHDRLLRNVQEAKQLLGSTSTIPVVWRAFFVIQHGNAGFAEHGLLAPFRQVQYLLGLLVTTDEPMSPRNLTDGEWRSVLKLVSEVYMAYAMMFWPTPEELPVVGTEKWRRPREVAMPAFLHFFTQGSMASSEQTRERLRRECTPFDSELRERIGITATDVIAIIEWVNAESQRRLDSTMTILKEMKVAHGRFVAEGWGLDRAMEETKSHLTQKGLLDKMGDLQIDPLSVSLHDLEARFGEANARSFWSLLVSRRSSQIGFTYPTEANPVASRPLIETAPGSAMSFIGNVLYEGALVTLSNILTGNESLRDRYLKRRDFALEKRVEEITRPFFGGESELYVGVFETPHCQFEHDLVVLWRRSLIVFESKASPPVEPFRDPDKAFTRIERAFKSDRGIQKAFDQANRVRRAYLRGESIRLYDSDGELVRTIDPTDIDDVYCVCVTADGHGMLASSLELLLEKADDDSFPWAVSVNDLETFLAAFPRKDWGPERLIQFLSERRKLHGYVFSDDEMEFAGFFVLHGSLESVPRQDGTFVQLQPGFSSVFDALYAEKHRGHPATIEAIEPPTFTDMSQFFQRGGPLQHQLAPRPSTNLSRRTSSSGTGRVGRNDPCPCRSGLKYKKCCYRRLG